MKNRILLDHGSGGKLTQQLIDKSFIKHFDNDIIKEKTDSALLKLDASKIAFTSDSYVINPIFFPGGDIGKLSVCGTVNDLAVSGAKPLFLSCGFIIEEGFTFTELERIVVSMAKTAKFAGVEIVTGDTKIVEKGGCDKIFINTSGIGLINPQYQDISYGSNIQVGDKIIVNGNIADHAVAVLSERNSFEFKTQVESDCACLNKLIQGLLDKNFNIKFLRDATRGGVATILCELAHNREFGIVVDEKSIPVREDVSGICELLGFDPLYLANEGKVIFVVSRDDADNVLETMRQDMLGQNSQIIGEITSEHKSLVTLETKVGGRRIIEMLAGGQLPRIC